MPTERDYDIPTADQIFRHMLDPLHPDEYAIAETCMRMAELKYGPPPWNSADLERIGHEIAQWVLVARGVMHNLLIDDLVSKLQTRLPAYGRQTSNAS